MLLNKTSINKLINYIILLVFTVNLEMAWTKSDVMLEKFTDHTLFGLEENKLNFEAQKSKSASGRNGLVGEIPRHRFRFSNAWTNHEKFNEFKRRKPESDVTSRETISEIFSHNSIQPYTVTGKLNQFRYKPAQSKNIGLYMDLDLFPASFRNNKMLNLTNKSQLSKNFNSLQKIPKNPEDVAVVPSNQNKNGAHLSMNNFKILSKPHTTSQKKAENLTKNKKDKEYKKYQNKKKKNNKYSNFKFGKQQNSTYSKRPDMRYPHKENHFPRKEKYKNTQMNEVVRDPLDHFSGQGQSATSEKGQSATYTNWSKWSRCSRHCHQSRRRRCRIPSLCGTKLIKEKRPCVGWRCQQEKFHFINPEEITEPVSPKRVTNTRNPPRADVRVLLNYNSMFYTRWSAWAPCSLNCLTSRYRTCRYPLFCSNSVIREEAYCYTENSACERWYKRHKIPSMPNEDYSNSSKSSHAHKTELISNGEILAMNQGHNISDNTFSLPGRNPNVLSFQIGSQGGSLINSQFSGQTSGQNLIGTLPDYQIHENSVTTDSVEQNAIKFNRLREKNRFNIPVQTKEENYQINRFANPKTNNNLKSPNFGNNFNLQTHFKWDEVDNQDPSHLQRPPMISLGRQNSLPQQCGVSKIQKPPWTLKIIGGRESPPEKWPWQVAILNRFKEVFCGGTLVAAQWIVTAAHCLRKRLYVRLAEHDLAIREGPEIEYKITETVPHPLYDATTVDNDVALLRLPEPISLGDRISPVCIPEQGTPLPVGKECTIIGWGKERNNHFFGTDVLNEAEVPIISEKACRKVYEDYYITQNMFCAGYLNGRIDSCAGDSGGPLLCYRGGSWYIYGITSFGEGCGRKGKFGIYAKVSNYKTWISDVIGAHAHRSNNRSIQDHQHRHQRRHAKYRARLRTRSKFIKPNNYTNDSII